MNMADPIVVSPTSFNFGSVNVGTTSAMEFFLISNTSASNVVLGQRSLTGINPDQFRIVNDDCSNSTLKPGENCYVSVVFEPTIIQNGLTAILNIPFGGGTLLVPLSGNGVTGLAVPVISVSPSSYDFGTVCVGRKRSAKFTITNAGCAPLTISSITIDGLDAGSFKLIAEGCSGPCCCSCTFRVVFAPLKACTKVARITINSNDPAYPVATIPVEGKACYEC
jgi:hypothetical protein